MPEIDQEAMDDASVSSGPNTRGLPPIPESAKAIAAFHSGLRRIAWQRIEKAQNRVGKRKISKTDQRLIADIVACSLPQISRHRGAIVPDHHAGIQVNSVALVQSTQTEFGFFAPVQVLIVSTKVQKKLPLE